MCGNGKQPLHGSRLCSQHWDHNLQTGGSLKCATKSNCTLLSFFLLPLLRFFSSCFCVPLPPPSSPLLPSPFSSFSSLPPPTISSLPPPTPFSQTQYCTLQPEGLNTKVHFYSKEHWYAFAEWYSPAPQGEEVKQM